MFDIADSTDLNRRFQYGFRGLLFGSGTNYVTESVEGLLGAPTARTFDIERMDNHGHVAGAVLMPKRTISFDILIAGSKDHDTNEEVIRKIREAFQVPRVRNARSLEPLTFWRPDSPKMVSLVRCTRRDITSNFKLARGAGEASVEFQAPDPILHSLKVFEQEEQLAGAVTFGTFDIYQDGDFVDGASPRITLTGPCTDPIITNTTDDDRAIKLDVALDPGDDLVIDVNRRMVYINGVKDYSVVRSDNQWWNLLPGLNVVTYNRSAGNSGGISEAIFEWRSAYQ